MSGKYGVIVDRDAVREGDHVYWGALGYRHDGVLVSGATMNARYSEADYEPDALMVPGGGSWYADFMRAERTS